MKNILHNILSKYKWYRKRLGGVWFHNRCIFNGGTSVIYCWSRYNRGIYFSKKEDYSETLHQRRKRIIKEVCD